MFEIGDLVEIVDGKYYYVREGITGRIVRIIEHRDLYDVQLENGKEYVVGEGILSFFNEELILK